MSLKEFVASVRTDGLMRQSRFKVEMGLPDIFYLNGSNIENTSNPVFVPDSATLRKVLLYCDETMLPGMSVSTNQIRTYGEIREIPWEKLYDNVSFGFYVDNAMTVKYLFDYWIGNIQNPITREMRYYNDYTTDITIYVADSDNQKRHKVILHECYPKSINSISLSHSAKDVMKVSVSMNYKYWTSAPDEGELDDYDSADKKKSFWQQFKQFQEYYNQGKSAIALVKSGGLKAAGITTGVGMLM